MLANRVQETTTTTGTGNITLAGAATNLRTFTSQFAANQRFRYFIDDDAGGFEHGIGYLSASTTLVRETVIDSSNSNALVNFGAGTKQVYVSQSSNVSMPSFGTVPANTYHLNENTIYMRNAATLGVTTNTSLWQSALWTKTNRILSVSVFVSTANGTKGRIALARDVNGRPDTTLLEESADLDTSTTGLKEFTLSAPLSIYGRFWAGFIADGGPSLQAEDSFRCMSNTPLGIDSSNFGAYTTIRDVAGPWTVFPPYSGAPGSLNLQNNIKFAFKAE